MKVVKIPVFWEYNWNGLLKSAMVKKQIQWGKLWIIICIAHARTAEKDLGDQ